MSQCIEPVQQVLNAIYFYNAPVQGSVGMGDSSTFFRTIQQPKMQTVSTLFRMGKEGFDASPNISAAVRYPYYGKGCKYTGVC